MNKPVPPSVKWGIMATGKIAAAMAKECAFVAGTDIIAVGSRTHASARTFAHKWNIPRAYGSYAGLASDPDCDLIYIATPHNSHFDLIQMCLNAGKHVLCEKPLTLNAGQAKTCADLARARGLFLMEAVWTRFFPAIDQVKHWINSGDVGRVNRIHAAFSFAMPFDAGHRLFNPALAGGALLDLGIYPISLATMILGMPDHISGDATLGDTGVDEDDRITLEYTGGAVANLRCGLRTDLPVIATVTGKNGTITIHERFHHPTRTTLEREGQAADTREFPCDGSGYHYQIAAVSEAVRTGLQEHPLMPLADTISILEIMDTLRKSWGLHYPDE